MIKKLIAVVIKVVFIGSIFILLFSPETFGFPEDKFEELSFASLLDHIKGLDKGTAIFWLGFAAAIKIAGIMAGVVRWRILLRGQGVHIPFWYLTKCWFWGRAIGLFLPGTLGLDGYRLVESSRYTGEAIKCATVIVVEKLTGIIALFGLVFLTIPLGMRLFDFNLIVLAIVLTILGGFISVSLILLFQPRIVQVLVAVLPLPQVIKAKVNKIGAAVTAYGHNRMVMFKALFFGLCVHLAICLMYFGTATAMNAENTGLLDIFFASPLIIVGSVFAPTVSGAGVREVVMVTVLGGQAGEEVSFLFGHLGLWFGEIVPFLLSLPLLLLTSRPNRDELMSDIEAVRAEASHADETIHLTPEELSYYQNNVFGVIFGGIVAGALAGAVISIIEAQWIVNSLTGLREMGIFGWGAVAYAGIYACVGLGVAGVLLFFYLLLNKFPNWKVSFGLSYLGAFGAGGMIIGMFRLKRDVLGGMNPGMGDLIQLLLYVGGAGLIGMAVFCIGAAIVGMVVGKRPLGYVGGAIAGWVIVFIVAKVLGGINAPEVSAPDFEPTTKAEGPNIFLIAIDTLRADYVPVFNPDAVAKTPNFEAFAQDTITYTKGTSQASWTKASFGTIFSGMYPECHTATTKTASLPQGVETFPELLQAGGYYTQGFSNNPNITGIFGYDQGYVEYVDLKPSLLFGASESAAKLSMYEVLRLLREKVGAKVGMKVKISEYYQPAESVKETIFDWLDSGNVPEDNPFFLFTHFMDPHDPYTAPESKDGGYGRKRMGDNPDPEIWREKFQDAYIGEIEYLDIELGKFFDGLKERGLYDDALIILTADHGEEFCEHGGWWHGQTLYNEQTHVPFMVKLPGNQRAGERNDLLARNLDIAPTVLHFAGLEKGEMMQGQSLFDDAGMDTNFTISFAYAENNFEGIVLQAVQNAHGFKFIRSNGGNAKRELPAKALYDLNVDALEQDNKADQADVSTMQEQLDSTIDQYLQICEEGAVEPAAAAELTPEMQEQLESLGYLGDDLGL